MHKVCILIALLTIGFMSVHAQSIIKFDAKQASKLEAHPGNNVEIVTGESVILGQASAASGGTAPYEYSWKEGNNEFSLEPNPSVSPDETTTYTLLVTDSRTCTAIDSTTISIFVTGINDFTDNKIRIYPNPASDRFTIEFQQESCIVSFFDENGKQLWTRFLNGTSTFLSPQSPGIYLLKIKAGEKESTRKMIISK